MEIETKRDILKTFYKAFSGRGAAALDPQDPDFAQLYVNRYANEPEKDPILDLWQRLEWAESESVTLLTGFRGNGKSTELKRLKKMLEDRSSCRVFLVDMNNYLIMTKPLAIGDFILSLMAALTVQVREDTDLAPIAETYWERLTKFLQSEVNIKDLALDLKTPNAAARLGMQLQTEPTFKARVQEALRGHVTTLVEDGRKFVVELVTAIRKHDGDPDKKVVFLVDSMEHIRGVGEQAHDIHNSLVEVFSAQAMNLRFRQLHVLYTIPPFLAPLAPHTARNLGGHPITSWPNIHVRTADGTEDEQGLGIMESIVSRRFSGWAQCFDKKQLRRLATSSGGDLRDFFRLIKESLVRTSTGLETGTHDRIMVNDAVMEQVENRLRDDMLPVAHEDGRWLHRIHLKKDTDLETIEELPRLARFLDGNLIMNYQNGHPWYDIHPLLIEEVSKYRDG